MKYMTQNYLYYFIIACLAIIIVDTAWWGGINAQLFEIIFAVWLLERFVHCQMFHHTCRV